MYSAVTNENDAGIQIDFLSISVFDYFVKRLLIYYCIKLAEEEICVQDNTSYGIDYYLISSGIRSHTSTSDLA